MAEGSADAPGRKARLFTWARLQICVFVPAVVTGAFFLLGNYLLDSAMDANISNEDPRMLISEPMDEGMALDGILMAEAQNQRLRVEAEIREAKLGSSSAQLQESLESTQLQESTTTSALEASPAQTKAASTIVAAENTEMAGKSLLFLHIPKNAGTTVEELGIHANPEIRWGLYKTSYKDVTFPDMISVRSGAKCSYWHTPPSQFPQPNPYADPDYEVFCVVRDPWTRLVSEFIYTWTHYRKFMAKDLKNKECDRVTFNIWLKGMLASMERGNVYMNNCHMLPQYHFIKGQQGRTWCKHVLRFENLTSHFNKLMREWNLDIRMESGTKSNAKSDDACRKLSEKKLEHVYAMQLVPKVRKMYAIDFSHLGDSLKLA